MMMRIIDSQLRGTLRMSGSGKVVHAKTKSPLALTRSLSHHCRGYLEGQGDLVSRLVMGIIRVTIWVIRVLNPLTKSP